MKTGCIILAGGKSTRMGVDKALLEIDGKYFIEKIAEELSFFEEKIIAGGNDHRMGYLKTKLETFFELDSWKMVPDEYPNHGPIGGLHAALRVCESDAMFCASCDVPLITRELAEKMCDALKESTETCMEKGSCFGKFQSPYDAVIAVTDDGKCHPLCGVYRKELWELMKEHILQDNNRLMAILKKCHVKYVELDSETAGQLTNVNTREEYVRIKSLDL